MKTEILNSEVNTLIVNTNGMDIKIFPSTDDNSKVDLPDNVEVQKDNQNIFFTQGSEPLNNGQTIIMNANGGNFNVNAGDSNYQVTNMTGTLTINVSNTILKKPSIGIALCKNKKFILFLKSINGNVEINTNDALLIKIEMINGDTVLRQVTSDEIYVISENGSINLEQIDGQKIIAVSQTGNIRASFSGKVDEYTTEVVTIRGNKENSEELNPNPKALKDIKLATDYGDIEVQFGSKK